MSIASVVYSSVEGRERKANLGIPQGLASRFGSLGDIKMIFHKVVKRQNTFFGRVRHMNAIQEFDWVINYAEKSCILTWHYVSFISEPGLEYG